MLRPTPRSILTDTPVLTPTPDAVAGEGFSAEAGIVTLTAEREMLISEAMYGTPTAAADPGFFSAEEITPSPAAEPGFFSAEAEAEELADDAR